MENIITTVVDVDRQLTRTGVKQQIINFLLSLIPVCLGGVQRTQQRVNELMTRY